MLSAGLLRRHRKQARQTRTLQKKTNEPNRANYNHKRRFRKSGITHRRFQRLKCSKRNYFFEEGAEALKYLTDTDVEPFIIFSDIYMPKLSGIDLRQKIHENEDLRLKSIPYLFLSTLAEQQNVVDAYSKSVQVFFVKPTNYEKIKETMKIIIDYWNTCVSPNYIK